MRQLIYSFARILWHLCQQLHCLAVISPTGFDREFEILPVANEEQWIQFDHQLLTSHLMSHQVCLHDRSSLLRAEPSQPNPGSASKAHMQPGASLWAPA